MNKENIKKSAIYEYISKETGKSVDTIKSMFSRHKWSVLDNNDVSNYINRRKFEYQYKWWGIYSIINKKTKREYIGQTTNFRARSQSHISQLLKWNHRCVEMQFEFNKYKFSDFEFFVLIKIDTDLNELLRLEEQEILKRKNTYNASDTNDIFWFNNLCLKHKDLIAEFLKSKQLM